MSSSYTLQPEALTTRAFLPHYERLRHRRLRGSEQDGWVSPSLFLMTLSPSWLSLQTRSRRIPSRRGLVTGFVVVTILMLEPVTTTSVKMPKDGDAAASTSSKTSWSFAKGFGDGLRDMVQAGVGPVHDAYSSSSQKRQKETPQAHEVDEDYDDKEEEGEEQHFWNSDLVANTIMALASNVMDQGLYTTSANVEKFATHGTLDEATNQNQEKRSLVVEENQFEEEMTVTPSFREEQHPPQYEEEQEIVPSSFDLHRHDHDEEGAFTADGARLLSASFRVMGNSVGLMADAVRVLGDTAAGAAGASVKFVGHSVHVASSAVDATASLLEGGENSATSSSSSSMGRKKLTSERMLQNQQRNKRHQQDQGRGGGDDGHKGVFGNSRQLLGKSLRLFGSTVRAVGDTVLMAGSTTESLASSTVGLAEDSVRIVEDLARSVSSSLDSFRRNGESPVATSATEHPSTTDVLPPPPRENFLSFDTYPHLESTSIETGTRRPLFPFLDDFLQSNFQDTAGVPSLGWELFLVLALCYFASLWTLRSEKATTTTRAKAPVENSTTKKTPPVSKSESTSSKQKKGEANPVGGQSEAKKEAIPSPDNNKSELHHISQSIGQVATSVKRVVWTIPANGVSKMSHWTVGTRRRRQHVILLVVYALAWLYLTRSSQLRSSSIERNAEHAGYRNGTWTLAHSEASTPLTETVVWLNTCLLKTWRIPTKRSLTYPNFVSRAMATRQRGRKPQLELDEHEAECQLPGNAGSPTCDGRRRQRSLEAVMSSPYGGIEPFLATTIGQGIQSALKEAASKEELAHVSLYSFTLGSTPPLVRGITTRGLKEDAAHNILRVGFNVDILLQDFALVLGIKLSSLDYSLLPTTWISVHSVDVRFGLNLDITLSPQEPFVSMVNASFPEMPRVFFQISPSMDKSRDGMVISSLPVIRRLFQQAIQSALSMYVAPHYISIDVDALLSIVQEETTEESQERQETRIESAPMTPRTVSPRKRLDPRQTNRSSGVAGAQEEAKGRQGRKPRMSLPLVGALSRTIRLSARGGGTQQETTDVSNTSQRRGTGGKRRLVAGRKMSKKRESEERQPPQRAGTMRQLMRNPWKVLAPLSVAVGAAFVHEMLSPESDSEL